MAWEKYTLHNTQWHEQRSFDKYQSCLTRSLEEDFSTKYGKNILKNTKLQILSQFEQTWIRSSQGTCLLNIKAVWPAVWNKKIFLTKNDKISLKNTKLQISSQFEQTWIKSFLGTCIPNIKAVWPAVLKIKNFWPKMAKISLKIQNGRFHHNLNKPELGHP